MWKTRKFIVSSAESHLEIFAKSEQQASSFSSLLELRQNFRLQKNPWNFQQLSALSRLIRPSNLETAFSLEKALKGSRTELCKSKLRFSRGRSLVNTSPLHVGEKWSRKIIFRSETSELSSTVPFTCFVSKQFLTCFNLGNFVKLSPKVCVVFFLAAASFWLNKVLCERMETRFSWFSSRLRRISFVH